MRTLYNLDLKFEIPHLKPSHKGTYPNFHAVSLAVLLELLAREQAAKPRGPREAYACLQAF